MSTFTENYDLIKPSAEDYYDIQDFNENMDAIDRQLAAAEAKAAEIQQKMAAVDTQLATATEQLNTISGKIGSPADSGTDTLFGCMNGTGASVIKSVQRLTYEIPTKTSADTIPISKVNPEKCIVLLERLQDDGSSTTYIDYTLTATTLEIRHRIYSSTLYTFFGFQIIEFY